MKRARSGVRRVLFVLLSVLSACSKPPVELGSADYANADPQRACSARDGGAGIHDDLISANGIRYSVRTPRNYDPSIAHPLLVVFAAAGHNRFESERFSGFTYPATTAGFIVGYVDHRRLTLKSIERFGSIAKEISATWCVDPRRIMYTGHSDGGTVSAALAVQDKTRGYATVIAPSAAGMRAEDLDAYACPAPLPVMVMHNSDDELFPGFGETAAGWWARCNGCGDLVDEIDGCRHYGTCDPRGPVVYCEREGGHREWRHARPQILNFALDNFR